MTSADVQTIVLTHLAPLSDRCGLHGWEISIGYTPSVPDAEGILHRGDCTRLIDYQSAHISLNPDAFADEAGVLATLRHELFHIVLAPFDLYTSAVESVDMPNAAHDLLERIRDHAVERAVAGMERMWDGLRPRELSPESRE